MYTHCRFQNRDRYHTVPGGSVFERLVRLPQGGGIGVCRRLSRAVGGELARVPIRESPTRPPQTLTAAQPLPHLGWSGQRAAPPSSVVYRESGGVPTPPDLRPVSRANPAPGKVLPVRDARMRALAGVDAVWQAQAGSRGRGDAARDGQRAGAVTLVHAMLAQTVPSRAHVRLSHAANRSFQRSGGSGGRFGRSAVSACCAARGGWPVSTATAGLRPVQRGAVRDRACWPSVRRALRPRSAVLHPASAAAPQDTPPLHLLITAVGTPRA